jgi:hypothetical protein
MLDAVTHICIRAVVMSTLHHTLYITSLYTTRVPEQVSDDIDNPTGNRVLWDSTNTNTAPNKVW